VNRSTLPLIVEPETYSNSKLSNRAGYFVFFNLN